MTSNQLEISQINVFPIKSLAGFSQQRAQLTDRGLQYDRRWMLVDEAGKFLSQREYPQLALLQVELHSDCLLVQHQQKPQNAIEIPLVTQCPASQTVSIWEDQCQACSVSSDIDRWFSAVLQMPCRLVFMPEPTQRLVDADYRTADQIVSFADGFPYLIIGQASLDDLNKRLAAPVSMRRFRTNFVFSGEPPFIEDQWQKIRMGTVVFRVAKPCPRCTMTTVDPDTGVKEIEPLKTLASYRKDESGGVMFGQNLLHETIGEVAVGMQIEVLE